MRSPGTARTCCALACLAAAQVARSARAEDWPNFRGPSHDGISAATGLKTDWTEPIPFLWGVELGSAFSSFAIVDGRLYTCGDSNGKQTLICLNARDGKVVWRKPIEREYPDEHGSGTRATPTVSDGRVYIVGARGRLVCVDAADGAEIWSRQLNHQPRWGYSGSVLIEGDAAIVSGGQDDGALAAFDRQSGAPLWKAEKEIAGYATPYPFTFEGERYIVGFLGQSALIVRAADGKLAWKMRWQTDWDVNASAPIFLDGRLLLSSGYGHGAILLQLRKTGAGLEAETVWQADSLRNRFQSGVLHQGHVYTSDETGLKCVEFATGREEWQQRRMKYGTVVLAEGHLFVLTEGGELIIAPATPEGFAPRTRAEILDGRCWSAPVICDGNIYARNLERIVCLDLTP